MLDAGSREQAVRAALKMGLHVYVANPLATCLPEAIDVVQYATERKLTLVVDAPHRYSVTERTLAGWPREARHGALSGVAFTRPIPSNRCSITDPVGALRAGSVCSVAHCRVGYRQCR
jgi:predicted dehydrogenase